MTARPDLDRQLASWMEDQATRLAPDGLLERGLDRVSGTRQRPGWLVPERWRAGARTGRPATAADRLRSTFAVALVVVVVVAGAGLVLRPAMFGGPPAGQSLVPAASGSVAPSASVAPSEPASASPALPSAAPSDPSSAASPEPASPAPPAASLPALSPGFVWTGSMVDTAEGPIIDTAMLVDDGSVVIVHGRDPAIESYDPATGAFSLAGSLSATRFGHTATLLRDGRVLVTGGYNYAPAGQEAVFASAELYDPATGIVSPTGSMSTPREFHTATLLDDGRVLITGGITMKSGLSSAELYDPATGRFSKTGRMTTIRDQHTATRLGDGRVLIVGGGDEGLTTRSTAELYDPATGTFSATGSTNVGRVSHTATLLADGRVLIAGGRTPADKVYASAEVYDPGSGTFTSTGSMKTGRQQHTATLLPDGRVLVVGGYESDGQHGQALALAELYDPASGRFASIGSIGVPRMEHTATLLRDGQVLIAGGGRIGGAGGVGDESAILYGP